LPVLPVLDLKQRQVVRGIAGKRDQYRPIVSRLSTSSEPVEVARAMHAHFGFTEFYLADLDAISGAAPAEATFGALHQQGFRLWVDAGARQVSDALSLASLGVSRVIAGLETIGGPEIAAAICGELGSDRVVFSLDLKQGQPVCELKTWGCRGAWEIAQRVISDGVSRLLVLDLARVGLGEGAGTEVLCRRLRQAYPGLEITAGGGVRGIADVRALYAAGADNVLVASALHDGRLTRNDIV
jgi:phosphoribosylformimino-5-aminoimidazole carboxamide ribotide isomerase